ncbi:MAG: hypothetical protein FWF31_10265 [Desulfobulbus sp.]|nr:hypothetical protein [Desulfobulbus sp.]
MKTSQRRYNPLHRGMAATRICGWRLLLVWTWLVIGLGLGAGWNAMAEQTADGKDDGTCRDDYSQCFKERLPIQEMRVTAYTAAFAKRFGLEPPAPGTEPDNGLEALEFRVQRKREWTNIYFMNLYLYLDSRLPIKLPEAGVAGNKLMASSAHFFGFPRERWLKWSDEDQRYMNDLSGGYNMKAFLATMDYVPRKRGGADSIEYEEFHAELLPGLTYIRLNFPSALILGKSYNYKDVGIFLQRATGTDYRHQLNNPGIINPDQFLKFRLPDHILAKMKEWQETIKPVNRYAMQEMKERDNKQPKKLANPTEHLQLLQKMDPDNQKLNNLLQGMEKGQTDNQNEPVNP